MSKKATDDAVDQLLVEASVGMGDSDFANLAWDAADALGLLVTEIDNRSHDMDWIRNHGDLADKIVYAYDDMRTNLRELGVKHDRSILGRR